MPPRSHASSSALRFAASAGVFTGVVGLPLIFAPRLTGDALGLPDPAATRLIGLSDLLLAPGLLRGTPRWPWLVARAAANAGLGVYLGSVAGASARPGLLRSVAGAMAILTVVDGRLAARLRAEERR